MMHPRDAANAVAEKHSPPAALDSDLAAQLEHFRPYLLSLATAHLGRELAGKLAPSDIVQETILHGLRSLDAFRGEGDIQLANWLREILKNQIIIAQRRYSRRKRELVRESSVNLTDLPSVACPTPSSLMMKSEEIGKISAILEDLPDDCRLALELRHRDHLSFAEIGQRMARTEDAARMVYRRALDRVGKVLRFDVH